jgi:hypothetical protein
MLRDYLVREGFTMHRKNGSKHKAKTVVRLDDDEADRHRHQIEPIHEKAKAEEKKEAAK